MSEASSRRALGDLTRATTAISRAILVWRLQHDGRGQREGGSDGEGEKGRSALARNGRNSNETTATEEEEEEGEDGADSGTTSRIRRRRVFKAAGGRKVLEERNNDNEWRHCWLAVLAVASLGPPSALSYETTARKAKKILSRGGGGGGTIGL